MKGQFNQFYNKKRVLVTGHTGFKGSWLTMWLNTLGAEVTGLALAPNTSPSLFEAAQIEKDINSVIADIRDYDQLRKVFQEFKPEIVFHMAAQPLVKTSYLEPRFTLESNILGTINVFEAAREAHAPDVLLNITSDKCYDNKEQIFGYKETDAMGGDDIYSSSKGCSELLTRSYRNSFFNVAEYNKKHKTAVASARAGNVIGGGDWADFRLIPDCVRALSKQETIVIRHPGAIRPWQHVLEPLSGYLWLGAQLAENGPKYAQGWNFGPANNEIINVGKVVEKVLKIWGSGKVRTETETHHKEAELLKLDTSKAYFYLHWRAFLEITEALSKTIDWYKFFNTEKPGSEQVKKFSIDQINQYVALAQKKELKWALS